MTHLKLIALLTASLFIASPSFSAETTTTKKPEIEVKKEEAKKKTDLSILSTDEVRLYQYGEIGTGSLIGGGIFGTFLGFGTGHIFYGEYTTKGWIFTVGEFASIGVMAAGLSSGLTSCVTGSSSGCSNGLGAYFLGAMAFLGLRVWEIIDVWTLPGSHNSKYRAIRSRLQGESDDEAHLYLMPLITSQESRPPGYGLQLSLRF